MTHDTRIELSGRQANALRKAMQENLPAAAKAIFETYPRAEMPDRAAMVEFERNAIWRAEMAAGQVQSDTKGRWVLNWPNCEYTGDWRTALATWISLCPSSVADAIREKLEAAGRTLSPA